MKPKILIVEDELIIARDIKDLLEEEGYEAIINITTVSGAIEMIKEHHPALVLIDINLNEDKAGIEIGHYLLNLDTIPYMYITSLSDKLTLDEVKDTRPHGYIVKPFKPIDIKTTVSIVLNNYKHRAIEPVREDILPENDTPFIIKRTIDYINENINEKIIIADLAALTRWNTAHYIRLFTKNMNVTPYQYILQRKISRAAVLLEETTMSAAEIAYELGFDGYSNFYKAFRKVIGGSPEAYRNRKKARPSG